MSKKGERAVKRRIDAITRKLEDSFSGKESLFDFTATSSPAIGGAYPSWTTGTWKTTGSWTVGSSSTTYTPYAIPAHHHLVIKACHWEDDRLYLDNWDAGATCSCPNMPTLLTDWSSIFARYYVTPRPSGGSAASWWVP